MGECCGCVGDHARQSPPSLPHDGDTQNGTVPAWCEFVPSDYKKEACRGSGPGCRCADWCGATPSLSQEWNPECCGCMGKHPSAAPKSPPSQGGTRNGTAPAWCHFVPSDY